MTNQVEECTKKHRFGLHSALYKFTCVDKKCEWYDVHVSKSHTHEYKNENQAGVGMNNRNVCTIFDCVFFQRPIGEKHVHQVRMVDGEDVYFQTNLSGSESKNSYRKPIAVRYDLIPVCALEQLAQVYEEGAQVYGDAKYIEKPLPFSSIINHAFNHLVKLISGDRTELHAAKVMWAMASIINLEELQRTGFIDDVDLNDLSKYGSKVQEALQKRLDARGHTHTHGQDNKSSTVYAEDRKTEQSNPHDDTTRSSETVLDMPSGPSSGGFN